MTWIEKYRPSNFEGVRGQNEVILKIRNFIEGFGRTHRFKKSIILSGPPGTGKTTLAHVMAKEMNAEIFELNASDLRNREKLRDTLKPVIEQKSLIQENKIILVDEVDGISTYDWGGLSELLRLISITNWPIILTANDIWDKKFSELRKKSEVLRFKEIDYKTIKDVLISILRKENLFLDNSLLTGISLKANGDLRAAINDLQIASGMKDPSEVLDNQRNKETDVFNALRTLFKQKPKEEMLGLFDSVNLPLDKIMLWIEENIPLEYHGRELQKAYDYLSRADVFKGRIYKRQYWRFLVYENIFLSYGIASAKSPNRIQKGFTSYKKPERILKIWLNNQRTSKKKSIAQKYANYVHIGEKRAMKEFLLIKQILKNPKIRKELRLEEDEIAYLDKEKDFALNVK